MLFDTEAFNKALNTDLGRTKQPTERSTSQHYAAYLLQKNIVKKYTDGTTSKAAEDAARKKFLAVNDAVASWVAPVAGTDESVILNRMKQLFQQQCFDAEGSPRLTLGRAFNVGMVGPGASIGADEDNFVDKLFNSKLSSTHPILLSFYRQAIANCKPWRKAERARSFIHGDVRIVKGNKLFYVPKETVIARTAATEPTLNMFGQLGYGHLIERQLGKYHDIDLSVQPNVNQWMARSGSLNGEYATIDLSSASDTIGLGLLSYILPEALNKDLGMLRSPYTVYGGKSIKLNMVSTMGNGFTFPLQTWIFANLVLACMIEKGLPIRDIYNKRRYSVFGDDIICPSGIYDYVCRMLGACGFTVNGSKSFAVGPFRESCGGDFFLGTNVRSVYLKECTSDSHVYSLINRLVDWTERHSIPLPNTTTYLRSLVQFRPIPLYEDETSGIRVPLLRLTGRKTSVRGNYIYHKIVQIPDRHRIQPWAIEKFYHGFRVALLHGSFKGGCITSRVLPGCAVFKVVKCEAPVYWDFVNDARFTTEGRRNAFELNFPIRAT